MKKILLSCMAILLVMSGIASAEIKKEKDDTGLRVISRIESYSGVCVEFSKSIIGKEIFYRFYASSESNYIDYLLKDNAVSVGIDKYPDFYLDEYHYNKSLQNFARVEATIPLSLVERISGAKHIFITLATNRGNHFVANEVLDEWKQVINTTE